MMNIDKELLEANKQKHPEVYEGAYKKAVEERIRLRYPQGDVEAITSNFLAEPENSIYKAEFEDFQAYRRQCKAEVKREFGMEV